MLSLNQKIIFLKEILEIEEENYADSFKQDIIMFFDDDFTEENKTFSFLNKLNTFDEIENWLNVLLSKFVLKFDSEAEQEGDFIYEYLQV